MTGAVYLEHPLAHNGSHVANSRELATRPEDTVAILFILSDGESTDGDPLPSAEALKHLGVTVISCFVTNQEIANPRVLLQVPNAAWNKGAQLMFHMASPADANSAYARFLMKKGWTIYPQAKLFVQLNHSEVLEEFIQVVISPLEEQMAQDALPRGM